MYEIICFLPAVLSACVAVIWPLLLLIARGICIWVDERERMESYPDPTKTWWAQVADVAMIFAYPFPAIVGMFITILGSMFLLSAGDPDNVGVWQGLAAGGAGLGLLISSAYLDSSRSGEEPTGALAVLPGGVVVTGHVFNIGFLLMLAPPVIVFSIFVTVAAITGVMYGARWVCRLSKRVDKIANNKE